MPSWNYTLNLKDFFHDEEMSFEQKRDEIVRRIKASKFWSDDKLVLSSIVDDLECASDVYEFDDPWNVFYDYADLERIWVALV